MSFDEQRAGCFLERGVVAECGADHERAHDEPEDPAPIESVRLGHQAINGATRDERSEKQEHPIRDMEMACVQVGIDRRPVIPVGHREDRDKKCSKERQ